MPKFYDHIDLRTNQLKNAVIESAGTAPSTPAPVPGQIYYDSGDDAIYLRKTDTDGSDTDGWVALADTATYSTVTNGGLNVLTQNYSLDFNNLVEWDATPSNDDRIAMRIADPDEDGSNNASHRYVTFANFISTLGDMTGVDLTGTAGGVSITAESGTASGAYTATLGLVAANTTITSTTNLASILNTSLVVGRDSTDNIDFGTDNTIIFKAGNANQVKITDGSFEPIADNDVNLGSTDGTKAWKNFYVDGTIMPGIPSGADTPGTILTLRGGNSTGTGEGGDIIFKTASASGSSGEAQNNGTTALTIDHEQKATFAGNITVDTTAGITIGGHMINDIDITAECEDVDDHIMSSKAIRAYIASNPEGFGSGSGDITQVNITAGAGLTGDVDTTTGAHTQTIDVVGGDGITANANEIEVTVDNTTIELSASNGSGTVRAKTAAIADSGTGLATADQIHTFVTSYADASGTDNSTDVTLVTTSHDYLSLSSQAITLSAIDLTADVTGTLPIASGGTGSTSTTYCSLTTNVTGTLPVAKGGTGATSFADKSVIVSQDSSTDTLAAKAMTTDGSLLIGGSTNGPEVGTLTEGANITITNADGAITIAGTANDDVDVSVANLEARLPQIDTATTIGDGVAITAGGNFIVTGDLTVSGTTTTVNSTAISIEDSVMRLGGHIPEQTAQDGDVGVEFYHNGVKTNTPDMAVSGGSCMVTIVAHGYQVGDLVRVVGNATEALNGVFVVNAVTDDAFTFVIGSSPGDFSNTTQTGSVTVAERSFFGYDNSADVFSGFVDVTNTTDSPTGYTGTLMSAKFNDATLSSLTLGGHAMDDIQVSGDSFSDVDDELMSAAAINDRINTQITAQDFSTYTTGVTLSAGTGINVGNNTNSSGGAYSTTITCDLEGEELASTTNGNEAVTKFLRADGDGTCSWQVPSYATPIPDTNLGTKTSTLDVSAMLAGDGVASYMTATIAHSLSTLQPIVQLWLVDDDASPAASEQIEAQIDCTSTANVRITFAKLPPKDVRVTIIAPNVNNVDASYS